MSSNEEPDDRSDVIREQVYVGEEQPDEIKRDVIQVLNDQRDCVFKSIKELGCTDVIEMDIREMSESKPCRGKISTLQSSGAEGNR